MLVYNDNDKSYEYKSENGIIYSLYEGETITQLIDSDEQKSSDIVFIVLDNYIDIPTQFVNFVYGAEFLGKDKALEDTIKTYVDQFEEKNKETIDLIKETL